MVVNWGELYNFNTGYTILENMISVGCFFENVPCLAFGTPGGKVVLYDLVIGNLRERPIEVDVLNINRDITALHSFTSNNYNDILLVGTSGSLIAYDVKSNKLIFLKEFIGGCWSIESGHVAKDVEKTIICSGQCSLQGYSIGGVQLLWTILPEKVNSLCLLDFNSDGRNEIIAGCEDLEIKFYDKDEIVWEIYEDDVVIALSPLKPAFFAYLLRNGTFGVYNSVKKVWSKTISGRAKTMVAFDINGDGIKELIIGWENGKVLVVNSEMGSLLYEEILDAPIAAVTIVHTVGYEELDHVVVCTVNGLVKSFGDLSIPLRQIKNEDSLPYQSEGLLKLSTTSLSEYKKRTAVKTRRIEPESLPNQEDEEKRILPISIKTSNKKIKSFGDLTLQFEADLTKMASNLSENRDQIINGIIEDTHNYEVTDLIIQLYQLQFEEGILDNFQHIDQILAENLPQLRRTLNHCKSKSNLEPWKAFAGILSEFSTIGDDVINEDGKIQSIHCEIVNLKERNTNPSNQEKVGEIYEFSNFIPNLKDLLKSLGQTRFTKISRIFGELENELRKSMNICWRFSPSKDTKQFIKDIDQFRGEIKTALNSYIRQSLEKFQESSFRVNEMSSSSETLVFAYYNMKIIEDCLTFTRSFNVDVNLSAEFSDLSQNWMNFRKNIDYFLNQNTENDIFHQFSEILHDLMDKISKDFEFHREIDNFEGFILIKNSLTKLEKVRNSLISADTNQNIQKISKMTSPIEKVMKNLKDVFNLYDQHSPISELEDYFHHVDQDILDIESVVLKYGDVFSNELVQLIQRLIRNFQMRNPQFSWPIMDSKISEYHKKSERDQANVIAAEKQNLSIAMRQMTEIDRNSRKRPHSSNLMSHFSLDCQVIRSPEIEDSLCAHVETTSSSKTSSSNLNALIYGVIGKADGIFSENLALLRLLKNGSASLNLNFVTEKEKESKLLLRVLIGTPNSFTFAIRNVEINLRQFIMYESVPTLTTEPKGFVRFSTEERPNRIILWVEENFDYKLENDEIPKIYLYSIKYKQSLILCINPMGEVEMRTDDIRFASTMVQSLARYLKLSNLKSMCDFPSEFDKIRNNFEIIIGSSETNRRLNTELAETISTAKGLTLLITTIDDPENLKKTVQALNITNDELFRMHKIKEKNLSVLTESLKALNQYIFQASNLRVGTFKTQVIQSCKQGIKDLDINVLMRGIKYGE